MSKGILEAIGLWWERLHVFSDTTVQHPGVVCGWKRDLRPLGETEVQPGELVELHVRVPPDLTLPTPNPAVRFDILEFDWLFWSGTDDPLDSLRTPGAADPVGGFNVSERTLVDRPYSDAEPSLASVVEGFRTSRPTDFDTSVLVVRDADTGWKDIVAWWRVPLVDDREPRAYFVVELPGRDAEHTVRDGTSVPLRVARTATPGAGVRLHGTVVDSVVDAGEAAQPVPRATVSLGGRTVATDAAGRYAIDVRVGVGDTPLTVARPGIDTRTFTVRTSVRANGGVDVAVLDEGGVTRANATLAAGATAPATAQVNVAALVHRLSGTVVWPDTRIATVPPAAPIALTGRRVCALRLDAGPMRPQIPATTRDWDAIRRRPDVLRSARPGRPGRREDTTADGRFELSFVDLRAEAQYLIWVEATDPRQAGQYVPDAIVRTIPTPDMRRMTFAPVGPMRHSVSAERHDRRVVVSTDLLTGGVQTVLDVVKVVDTAPSGAATPVLRLLRAQPRNPGGIDAVAPVDVDLLPVDATARRVAGLTVEVLPLVPVFELAERRSPSVVTTRTAWETALDREYDRGRLTDAVRWVLDARRAPAAWDDPATCGLLERTLLTHPSLDPVDLHDPAWGWWRADAVSAADHASVDQQAEAVFANRRLRAEHVPILSGAVPRLLGLFERRHLHVSPGHGVFAVPAVGRAYQTDRGEWVGYSATIEDQGGEGENAAGIAAAIRHVAASNGVRVTVSRETDPTVPGLEQLAGGAFASVNPLVAADHDHPRLWQQSAYYWLAAVYDLNPGPLGALVRGHAAGDTYSAGINRRVTLFEHQASDPDHPLDVFVAAHTNGGAHDLRGYLTLYLDIRPTAASPAPNAGVGYLEANQQGLAFAQRIVAELAAETEFANGGARSYFMNNNPVRELALTTTHYRTPTPNDVGPVQVVRSRAASPGLQHIVFPTPGGRTIPVGYGEFGFHSNTDDAAALAQGWFRRTLGIAVARACEWELRQRTEPLSGLDVVALLRAMFGGIPTVVGLGTGAAPLGAGPVTAAQVVAAITAVCGGTPVVAAPTLDATVVAIEQAAASTRTDAVRLIATALAAKAGYAAGDLDVDPASPLPAAPDDATRARRAAAANAVVRPLLLALGATIPAGATPAMAHLPNGGTPIRRADAAGLLAAGLGVRPGDLATITRPINGTTVLAAAAPEKPDAGVPARAVADAATAIAALRPVDVYRLAGVRVTDARGNPLAAPLDPGAEVHLTVETAGTAWRVAAADVAFVLRRPGQADVALPCAVRRDDALRTGQWQVPTTAGTMEFSLSASVRHPDGRVGVQTLGPLRFSIAVQAQP